MYFTDFLKENLLDTKSGRDCEEKEGDLRKGADVGAEGEEGSQAHSLNMGMKRSFFLFQRSIVGLGRLSWWWGEAGMEDILSFPCSS